MRPQFKAVADCKTCHGEGGYYEDVAGDGGSRMYFDCECAVNALSPEDYDRYKKDIEDGNYDIMPADQPKE